MLIIYLLLFLYTRYFSLVIFIYHLHEPEKKIDKNIKFWYNSYYPRVFATVQATFEV